MLKEIIFGRSKRSRPRDIIPSVKTDLLHLDLGENILVWFGHSSYFIQIDGKRILVDPVFCGHASPFPWMIQSFAGTDIYSAKNSNSDIPDIDYLFITHDHYDHLDYKTIVALKPKIKQVITGLGTGSHLKYWGYAPEIIIEKDWDEEIILDDDFIVHTAPTRHFSGRLQRKRTQWTSFVLQTPTIKIYIGGDSGYDTHFKTIGDTFGPFDLAILECGQYSKFWPYIHMQPEQTVQAALDLRAKKLIPVHWGKFSLAQHAWDEPIRRVTDIAKEKRVELVTPMIGQKVKLQGENVFERWWEKIG